MRAAKSLRSHLTKAPVQNLALRHQVLDCSGDILNWDLWVDAVLIQKIYSVGSEPLEHSLNGSLDVVRLTVKSHLELAGVRVYVPTELRRDHDLIAERRYAFTENPFAFERAISLSRIEKRHAVVVGCPDDIDHLRTVRHGRLILAAHVLDAEAHRRGFERTQFASPTYVRLRAWLSNGGSGKQT